MQEVLSPIGEPPRAPTAPRPVPFRRERLKILPLPDLHLGVRPRVTQHLLANRAYLAAMDYVVLLGDQAPAWGTDEEYADVASFISELPVPYGAINGNHEFFFEVVEDKTVPAGRRFNQASPQFKRERLRKFNRFYGYRRLWRSQLRPQGRFLFLNLDDVDYHRPESLSGAQKQFLLAQLLVSQDIPVYVFCHAPLTLGTRLDMIYYDAERSGSVELEGDLRQVLQERKRPLFWISGHVHLRPDHWLYPLYELSPQVWQVHCPDGIGYSRWNREQNVPQMHEGLYTRHLEVSQGHVDFVTYDMHLGTEISRQRVLWPT